MSVEKKDFENNKGMGVVKRWCFLGEDISQGCSNDVCGEIECMWRLPMGKVSNSGGRDVRKFRDGNLGK